MFLTSERRLCLVLTSSRFALLSNVLNVKFEVYNTGLFCIFGQSLSFFSN